MDATTFELVAEVVVGELVANLGISPDGSSAFLSGIESLQEVPPMIKIFIVDLAARDLVGTLLGFTLPADISFSSGKPTLRTTSWPEITFQ